MTPAATDPLPDPRSPHHGPGNAVSDDSWLEGVPPIPGDDLLTGRDLVDDASLDELFPLIEPEPR